ncbi:hypothetical protein GGF43_004358 [Coemansia sp. RSA 2618]|nr:hypothetical protein GGF43_004358 [Coemansia sp. RSA 2618]
MIYISDSEDARPRHQQSQVSWAQCLPADIASSVVSLSSDSQLQLDNSQLQLINSQSQLNSSGWPSLLNVASNVSLLSSYTPPDTASGDADDVDALIQMCGADSDFELPASKFNHQQITAKLIVNT